MIQTSDAADRPKGPVGLQAQNAAAGSGFPEMATGANAAERQVPQPASRGGWFGIELILGPKKLKNALAWQRRFRGCVW